MSVRAEAEAMLARCQDRLQRRIRWMMGEKARGAGDTDDFLGEVTVRILDQCESLTWRDEAHFLALATRIARHLVIDRVRRPRLRRFESLTASLVAEQI
ncbi:MAG: hypothetical protein KDE27_29445, partial [Planctomycetes bacterium]|nr:hypothetical protein [Planctomycetota bacterium]